MVKRKRHVVDGEDKKEKEVAEQYPDEITKIKSLPRWEFPTNYNDHFETSASAIFDLSSLLYIWLKESSDSLKLHPKNVIVYDPYFCQGSVIEHFRRIGFQNIINKNRDFYKDIEQNNTPQFDILVTNPPFSSSHKKRCFEFAINSLKPFAILVPAYVLTKDYFTSCITASPLHVKYSVAILAPPSKYKFEHPEGTGHSSSPFFAVWIVWFNTFTQDIVSAYKKLNKKAQIIPCLADLPKYNITSMCTRPNPRKRQKQAHRT